MYVDKLCKSPTPNKTTSSNHCCQNYVLTTGTLLSSFNVIILKLLNLQVLLLLTYCELTMYMLSTSMVQLTCMFIFLATYVILSRTASPEDGSEYHLTALNPQHDGSQIHSAPEQTSLNGVHIQVSDTPGERSKTRST